MIFPRWLDVWLGRGSQLSVLVIDDDQDTREFLQDFFHLEGFEVTTLADPTYALERIHLETFHLLMLDLMMPKLYGLDLLAQIRAVDDDIPVIIMDSAASLQAASASIRYGVSGYIGHPLEPAELSKVIARIQQKRSFVLREDERHVALHVALGQRIRELRHARGLTFEQMARRTNLSVSLLVQMERAESSASVSSLCKVAAALDVRLTDLLTNL